MQMSIQEGHGHGYDVYKEKSQYLGVHSFKMATLYSVEYILWEKLGSAKVSVQEGHSKYAIYCGKKWASAQVSIQEGHSMYTIYCGKKNSQCPSVRPRRS